MVRAVFTRPEQLGSRLGAMQSADRKANARRLRRAGCGTTGPAVDAALRIGRAAQVRDLLDADPTADVGARRTPIPAFDAVAPLGRSASKNERQQRNQ